MIYVTTKSYPPLYLGGRLWCEVFVENVHLLQVHWRKLNTNTLDQWVISTLSSFPFEPLQSMSCYTYLKILLCQTWCIRRAVHLRMRLFKQINDHCYRATQKYYGGGTVLLIFPHRQWVDWVQVTNPSGYASAFQSVEAGRGRRGGFKLDWIPTVQLWQSQTRLPDVFYFFYQFIRSLDFRYWTT